MKAFTIPTIFSAIDKFSKPVDGMNKKLKSFSDTAFRFARNTAIAGAAILAPLVLAANSAIKFEDRMADVAKTTQIAGSELSGLGSDLLDLATTTRTPIEGLQKIATIGGQLGITGRKNIVSFTESVNKFSVALGSDFEGGVEQATRAIGGLNVLFKETRKLDIADSITRAGSAINALSAKGVQVPELTEFTARIGQLPDAIKPTVQETIALGAVFNKAGISAEIAARGLGDVLITASQNAPKFAKQMGLSTDATRDLLNTNPTEFLKKFATSLRGINASQFAKLSKNLKLADVGSIKVIGSLSSSVEKLGEFQALSNAEFAKGTSLLNEYNIKNEITAAKLAIAKNKFEALAITIGTELIPIVSDLLKEITPIIKGAIDWVRNNKELTKTLIKVAIGVSAFLFVMSAVSTVVGGITAAIALYNGIVLVAQVITAVWNAILLANPLIWVVAIIVLAIAAITALIYVVVQIVKHWDELGAGITLLLGPLGLVINLVMSFVRNWETITKAFSEGGVLAGFKAIGAVILDSVLYPLEQIMSVIAKITGADWAANAASGLKDFRASLDLKTEEDNSVVPVNPEREKREAAVADRFEEISRQQLDVNINDPTGRATTSMGSGPIPIKLSSTHKFGS